MNTTPEFRDIDGTVLQYGEVVDIGVDYVQIYALGTKESWFVYKPEQILYLYSEGDLL